MPPRAAGRQAPSRAGTSTVAKRRRRRPSAGRSARRGSSPGHWRTAGLHDSTDDARAALAVLRARPEVDPERVVVLGHSEGALHAGRLAADGDLAGMVLLSASATPGEELLRWQTGIWSPRCPPACACSCASCASTSRRAPSRTGSGSPARRPTSHASAASGSTRTVGVPVAA